MDEDDKRRYTPSPGLLLVHEINATSRGKRFFVKPTLLECLCVHRVFFPPPKDVKHITYFLGATAMGQQPLQELRRTLPLRFPMPGTYEHIARARKTRRLYEATTRGGRRLLPFNRP